MRSRIRPIASARRRRHYRWRQEEVRWFSREGDWSVGLLFAVVVGRLIFLGFVELAKEFGLDVEEECSDEEDAESSSINKVVVLVGIG